MKRRMFTAALMVAAMGAAGTAWVDADGGSSVAAVLAGKEMPKLVMGAKAPEIEAVDLDGKAVTLESLAGKPVVLQFGSLTEPIFRMRAEDSEKLAAKYGDQVTFLIVYQREAHPADGAAAVEVNVQEGFGLAKPVNMQERVKLAQQTVDRLKIAKQRVVVDVWSDTSSLRYGGYPNMTFVVDAKGDLQAGYAWMDPAKVKGALDAVLAGKPVPAEYRGKTEPSSPGQLDVSSAAREMGGARGGGIAMVLDHLTLTDKQKEAIYPVLGAYLAEARDFREKRGGGGAAAPGGRAAGAPARSGAAPQTGAMAEPMAGTAQDPIKAESPEDLQKAVESLRATAQKLKTTLKANLSDKDAKDILDVLEQGPAKRMFAD